MADIEVQYKGSTIKQQTGSGTVTLHTEGKYCEDDIDIVYTAPGGGGPSIIADSWDYTFAEQTSASPGNFYPSIIGSSEWADVAANQRRGLYLYTEDNMSLISPSNLFVGGMIWSAGGSTPQCINARLNSSGVINVGTGTGSATVLKCLAGATVHVIKLKNEKLDTI